MNDTLRQAIAAWFGRGNQYAGKSETADDDDLANAETVLFIVMADPTVRRWKAIADAVDNEEDIHPEFGHGKSFNPGCADCGHDSLIRQLRAAGKTT